MAAFDPLVHQPARLRIMATLAAVEEDAEVDFSYLRELLDLTDGNLGAHLAKLEAAGYLKQHKTFVDRKPKTYIRRTRRGKFAYDEHVEALKEIVDQ
jgi:DNA-binding MarR family transcriptional regulator